MNIDLKRVSWDEFKKLTNTSEATSDYETPIYRGHSRKNWMLKTTLCRFTNKNSIEEKNYYDLVLEIRNKYQNIFGEVKFSNNLNNSPLDHLTIAHLVTLRHLGFPSPILDWTNCPFIAAFFALSNINNCDECAIYCLKKSKKQREYNLNVCMLDTITHDEIKNLISKFEITAPHPRHENQKASYSWCIDYKNSPNRKFYLAAIDELNDESHKFKIVKYIIADSVSNRSCILNEIYNKNISFETMFGDTHIYENSILKDIAVRNFLISTST